MLKAKMLQVFAQNHDTIENAILHHPKVFFCNSGL